MTQTQARQDVMDGLLAQARAVVQPGVHKNDWQFLEVKQMAEIAHRYRVRASQMLEALRDIETRRTAQTDEVEQVYASYEAMFARDNFRASLRLYRIANHDFHTAYADYMSKVSQTAFPWISALANNQNANTGVADSRAA